jgi:hypothetical protein
MHNKATKKLARSECNDLAIFGTESNRLMRYGHYTAITDSDPMGVTSEVAQYVHRFGEGLFDINQPIDFGQCTHKVVKR